MQILYYQPARLVQAGLMATVPCRPTSRHERMTEVVQLIMPIYGLQQNRHITHTITIFQIMAEIVPILFPKQFMKVAVA